MANRTVFSDENDNEMDCYINTAGMVYIGIGQPDDGDNLYRGYITLDKSDVSQFIKLLTELKNEMSE